MVVSSRLNPTLFDKLVADSEIEGVHQEASETGAMTRESMARYSVARLTRFNEAALRATVRREIAWLLNTTNLGAAVDLEPYPRVETSVLNYGVPDLAGKAISHRAIVQRAREIRAAIRAFEPRIDEASLVVEPLTERERENAVTYVIQGDITSAVNALPIKLKTDIETDNPAVTVRG